jgi:hypothetical protein
MTVLPPFIVLTQLHNVTKYRRVIEMMRSGHTLNDANVIHKLNQKLDCGEVSDGRATADCAFAFKLTAWNSAYLRYGDCHDNSTKNKRMVGTAAFLRYDATSGYMTSH